MKRSFIITAILLVIGFAMLTGCGKTDGGVSGDSGESKGSDTVKQTENQDIGQSDNGIYNVTDYEIIPNAPEKASSNSEKLARLLEKACSSIHKPAISSGNESTIFFPEGDYYFESAAYGCFMLDGLELVTFEGEGATIINSSYDPTLKQNTSAAGRSVTVGMNECRDITFKNLTFDYARYTQVCGEVVSNSAGRTIIRIDDRYINGEGKIPLTGDEYVMAVNVLDPDGNVIGDYYAPEKGFDAMLAKNLYSIEGVYGSAGDTVIARFTLGTYASPTFFAVSTRDLKFENVRSYSSPTATFYATLDNENFSFDGLHIAPPEGAEWLWGTNVDSIHIKGIRGKVTVKNSIFRGLGDDALNVHSISPKVTEVSGNEISVEYIHGGKVDKLWCRKGDEIEFYDQSLNCLGSSTVKKAESGRITFDSPIRDIPVGAFARNKTTSPDLEIENVTVDGGRARAFLIQTRNATIKNCRISNLGLAGIIIAPDIQYWGEMGPCENAEISGVDITNVCTMKNAACLGAILVSTGHDAALYNEIVHGNVKVTDCTFTDVNAPALYAISTWRLDFLGNTLSGNTQKPYHLNCGDVNIEEN